MTIYVAMQLGYQIALAALCTLILLTGEGRMKRTVLTIFAVMLAAWLLKDGWPSVGYAWEMIAVDALALVVICWRPAGKWQSIVGLTYIVQVTVHFGRIIAGDAADINAYWWGLSLGAIAQLFLLGGWWFNEWLAHRRLGRDNHPASADSGHAGVAR